MLRYSYCYAGSCGTIAVRFATKFCRSRNNNVSAYCQASGAHLNTGRTSDLRITAHAKRSYLRIEDRSTCVICVTYLTVYNIDRCIVVLSVTGDSIITTDDSAVISSECRRHILFFCTKYGYTSITTGKFAISCVNALIIFAIKLQSIPTVSCCFHVAYDNIRMTLNYDSSVSAGNFTILYFNFNILFFARSTGDKYCITACIIARTCQRFFVKIERDSIAFRDGNRLCHIVIQLYGISCHSRVDSTLKAGITLVAYRGNDFICVFNFRSACNVIPCVIYIEVSVIRKVSGVERLGEITAGDEPILLVLDIRVFDRKRTVERTARDRSNSIRTGSKVDLITEHTITDRNAIGTNRVYAKFTVIERSAADRNIRAGLWRSQSVVTAGERTTRNIYAAILRDIQYRSRCTRRRERTAGYSHLFYSGRSARAIRYHISRAGERTVFDLRRSLICIFFRSRQHYATDTLCLSKRTVLYGKVIRILDHGRRAVRKRTVVDHDLSEIVILKRYKSAAEFAVIYRKSSCIFGGHITAIFSVVGIVKVTVSDKRRRRTRAYHFGTLYRHFTIVLDDIPAVAFTFRTSRKRAAAERCHSVVNKRATSVRHVIHRAAARYGKRAVVRDRMAAGNVRQLKAIQIKRDTLAFSNGNAFGDIPIKYDRIAVGCRVYGISYRGVTFIIYRGNNRFCIYRSLFDSCRSIISTFSKIKIGIRC